MNDFLVKTERLQLRKITEMDFDELYNLLSNANVHRFFPKKLNRKESEGFLQAIQNKYDSDGYCFWAVIRKSDNKFIGICGPIKQIVDGIEEIEVAYRILDIYWGNGYGTEAVKGCIDYIRNVLKKNSVIALIREVNIYSIRVAENNGMLFEKETIFHDLPHRVYRKFF